MGAAVVKAAVADGAKTAAGSSLPDAATLLADDSFALRFREKYTVTPSGCWLWTARRNALGYGYFRVGGMMLRAHKVSFMLANGRWNDKNLMLLHDPKACNNPSCVNPAHLREGTQEENEYDKLRARGIDSWRGPIGEILRGGSPLSVEEVLTVRRLTGAESAPVKLPRMDAACIAVDLGCKVSARSIQAIAAHETFRWCLA